MIAKRLFDFTLSLLFLLILLPLFIFLGLWVFFDSKGGIFYKQIRVGKNGKEFIMYKFRTMHVDAEKKGLLTVGNRDNRITRAGYFLRKYKLDEFPQLLNVLLGNMSIVGPRPEVRKYVDIYTREQKKVLIVKPGITDYASIQYIDENELLSQSSDPELLYIKEIMPQKLELNLKYISTQSFLGDIKIIIKTLFRIIR